MPLFAEQVRDIPILHGVVRGAAHTPSQFLMMINHPAVPGTTRTWLMHSAKV